MAISNTYLNSYYSSMNSLYSGLFNTSRNNRNNKSYNYNDNSNDSLTSFANIVSRYAYFKSNYSDIKASFRNVDKDYVSDSTKNNVKSSNIYTNALSEANKMKIAAKELKESSNKLVTDKESIFELNENDTYDMDKVYDSVNEFVTDYNDLKKMTSETSSDSVVEKAYYMVNMTKNYTKPLSKIGITVNSDNTLSINKDTFKESDINTIKSLFNGNYSYANLVNQKANQISNVGTSSYISYTSSSKTNTVLETYLSELTNISIFDYLA